MLLRRFFFSDGDDTIDFYTTNATKVDTAIAEYMEAFHRIDVDGSGSLSPDELRDVMVELGEEMNEKELDAMIQEADHDGDGEINYGK